MLLSSQGIEACTHLEELDLSGNRIADLGFQPEEHPFENISESRSTSPLEALQRLHTLRLNSNRLKTLNGLGSLPALRELQVADNELTHVGRALSDNKKLEKINVAAN